MSMKGTHNIGTKPLSAFEMGCTGFSVAERLGLPLKELTGRVATTIFYFPSCYNIFNNLKNTIPYLRTLTERLPSLTKNVSSLPYLRTLTDRLPYLAEKFQFLTERFPVLGYINTKLMYRLALSQAYNGTNAIMNIVNVFNNLKNGSAVLNSLKNALRFGWRAALDATIYYYTPLEILGLIEISETILNIAAPKQVRDVIAYVAENIIDKKIGKRSSIEAIDKNGNMCSLVPGHYISRNCQISRFDEEIGYIILSHDGNAFRCGPGACRTRDGNIVQLRQGEYLDHDFQVRQVSKETIPELVLVCKCEKRSIEKKEIKKETKVEEEKKEDPYVVFYRYMRDRINNIIKNHLVQVKKLKDFEQIKSFDDLIICHCDDLRALENRFKIGEITVTNEELMQEILNKLIVDRKLKVDSKIIENYVELKHFFGRSCSQVSGVFRSATSTASKYPPQVIGVSQVKSRAKRGK